MFDRQFLLAYEATDVPPGWKRRRFAGLMLHFAPELPVVGLDCADGEGLLLGWPIHHGRLWSDGETIGDADDLRAPLFPGLSGRFLLLLAEAASVRCYLDPCGFLPAIYCPSRRILASTTGLIAPGEDCGDDAEVRAALDIPARSNWFPFGLTGRIGVHRLLPNHVLDLGSFAATRYWPAGLPGELPDGAPVDAIVDEIARLLQENVAAVAAEDAVMCNLTAGRDSRMMLAAARPHLDRITFSTFRFDDRGGSGDCDMAGAIARRFGLRHRELECIDPVQGDVDDWLRDTGTCVAGRTMLLATSSRKFARVARFSLSGLAGELGRAADWRGTDAALETLSNEELLDRLGIVVGDLPRAIAEAGTAWREALGPVPLPLLLDMALIDLWIASCSGPSFYGHCHGGISISPFNDRRLIERMFRLPRRYKMEQRLTADLLDRMWPELNLFPFNPTVAGRGSRVRDRIAILKRRIFRSAPARMLRGLALD